MAEIHNVIAAFADGERVPPDALNAALADESGRAYFIDLLVLRGLVHAAGPELDLPRLAPLARDRWPRFATWVGVAAALVVSVLGGYAVGRRTAPVALAPAVAAIVEPAAAPARPATAPLPTRVIRLEPGVDWKENIGG
jgi:hypothetical protein